MNLYFSLNGKISGRLKINLISQLTEDLLTKIYSLKSTVIEKVTSKSHVGTWCCGFAYSLITDTEKKSASSNSATSFLQRNVAGKQRGI